MDPEGREFVIVVITRRVVNVAYSPFRFFVDWLFLLFVLSFLYIVKKVVNLILSLLKITFSACRMFARFLA